MERAVRSVADRVGFRADFDYARHILSHDWEVVSVHAVNLFGLSKLIVLRNTPAHTGSRMQASSGAVGAKYPRAV